MTVDANFTSTQITPVVGFDDHVDFPAAHVGAKMMDACIVDLSEHSNRQRRKTFEESPRVGLRHAFRPSLGLRPQEGR